MHARCHHFAHACLAPQDQQEAPAAGITALDEVWENERYVFLKGWGSPGLMPQDVAARKKRFKHGGEGYDSFPTLRCPAGENAACGASWRCWRTLV